MTMRPYVAYAILLTMPPRVTYATRLTMQDSITEDTLVFFPPDAQLCGSIAERLLLQGRLAYQCHVEQQARALLP